jgi:hypothetical protein
MTSTTPMKDSMTGKTHLDSKGQWIRVEEGDIATLVKEVMKDLRPDEVYHMEEIIKTVQESCDPRAVFGDDALLSMFSVVELLEWCNINASPEELFEVVELESWAETNGWVLADHEAEKL